MADDHADDHTTGDHATDDVLVTLPEGLRGELKTPFGPIETDADALLAEAGRPVVAVGDVVTHHLLDAGSQPAVAVVDGRTQRGVVDREIERAVTEDVDREVDNPPATLTRGLVSALVDALRADDPVTILVDGEEDLAVLPAILAAPDGASVVYGQPGEGMVHVRVDDERRERVRTLLERFDGDVDDLFAELE